MLDVGQEPSKLYHAPTNLQLILLGWHDAVVLVVLDEKADHHVFIMVALLREHPHTGMVQTLTIPASRLEALSIGSTQPDLGSLNTIDMDQVILTPKQIIILNDNKY